MRWAGVLVGLGCVSAGPAMAGPWVQPDGEGQAIFKYEEMRAEDGFDSDGSRVPLEGARVDRALGVFAEYGLTPRLTLQFKGELQEGDDALVDYSGRGPVEIGLTWQAWRDDHGAVSVYGGYADGGDGRNAVYAAPGVGQRDWEIRASAGRSFGHGVTRGWRPDRSFVDVQVARRMRDGLRDETRAEATVGSHFGDRWLVLGQAFGGATDGEGARWLSVETSVVRHLGAFSVQAGWRRTVSGRDTPLAEGAVIAVWRRF